MGDIRTDPRVQSILLKIKVYCDYYRLYKAIDAFPSGVEEGADAAVKDGRTSYLKAISRELDVRAREILDPDEQDRLIEMMVSAGVQPADVPASVSVKKIRNLMRRGAIRSEAEHLSARVYIVERAALLTPDERIGLGRMLDIFEVGSRN